MEQENFPQFLGILTSNYYSVQSRLTKRLCLSTAKLLLKPNKEITRDIVFKIIIMVDSEEKMIFIQPTMFTKIKVTSDQKMLNKLTQGVNIYIYIYIWQPPNSIVVGLEQTIVSKPDKYCITRTQMPTNRALYTNLSLR